MTSADLLLSRAEGVQHAGQAPGQGRRCTGDSARLPHHPGGPTWPRETQKPTGRGPWASGYSATRSASGLHSLLDLELGIDHVILALALLTARPTGPVG